VALTIAHEKMWSAVRIEVKNCPALAARIVESSAVAEFGHEKQAVAFRFRIVEAKIHPSTRCRALIACSIVKDSACSRAASLPSIAVLPSTLGFATGAPKVSLTTPLESAIDRARVLKFSRAGLDTLPPAAS